MADENKKSEVKVGQLSRDEEELTQEEAKEVKGGLKMAPAAVPVDEKPPIPGA